MGHCHYGSEMLGPKRGVLDRLLLVLVVVLYIHKVKISYPFSHSFRLGHDAMSTGFWRGTGVLRKKRRPTYAFRLTWRYVRNSSLYRVGSPGSRCIRRGRRLRLRRCVSLCFVCNCSGSTCRCACFDGEEGEFERG